MTMKRNVGLVALVAVAAGTAHAQSASVRVEASSATVSVGESVTISVIADIDTMGDAGGRLGVAGLYGFGGDLAWTSGSLTAGDFNGVFAEVDPGLNSASTALIPGGSLLSRAGGTRGYDGALTTGSHTLFTTTFTVDESAADGDVTIDFEGDVLLVLGDSMRTFSSTPVGTQATLSTQPLQLPVSSGSQCAADQTTSNTNPGDAGYGEPDGSVDTSDLTYFVERWLAGDVPVADVSTTNTNPGDGGYGQPDGVVTTTDLTYYVEVWIAGCP